MTLLRFLVELNTDRESGAWASRDEISDIIVEAIEQGAESAELSGLGPNSSSEYSIDGIEVTELDPKATKALWKENDQHALDERLTPTQTEQAFRTARKELDGALRHIAELEGKLAERKAEAAKHATRIWIRDSGDRGKYIFLPDGRYDTISYNLSGEPYDRSETIDLHLEDNIIEIRNNLMARQMVVMPYSGNVLRIGILGEQRKAVVR